MKQKYILFALIATITLNLGQAQQNYTVNSIPYVPYQAAANTLNTSDDLHSSIIALPFTFDFYGSQYNSIVISTNGYLSFNTGLANTSSQWSFNAAIPTTVITARNAIYGAYHDMYNNVPSSNGSITYGVYGSAPYRKFIVYFDQNPLFSCNTLKSSFQMVLHETSNIIDVVLIDKQSCPTWNSGNTVTGIMNTMGTMGLTPPGRNTGNWTAYHESWRFSRPGYYANYNYVVCDPNNDGIGEYSVATIQNDLLPTSPTSVMLYPTMADAGAQTNAITGPIYTSLSQNQVIYAVYNGQIKSVTLQAIDCAVDVDADTVPTDLEDLNADTNLANDDTDADGIPNYSDNDDDGDMILTNLEYVFPKTNTATTNVNTALDTDNDGTPNYLDNDDDGDGILTYLEDYNGNGNPADDDTNANGTPDYMESAVALGVDQNEISGFTIYPNPVNDLLTIQNPNQYEIQSVAIYNTNGALVKQVNNASIESIPVNDLSSGLYLIQVKTTTGTTAMKFIKQ
ncbi:MAG: hypothetical protein RL607_1664 [Bacteroidota bacterium]|jgi:hypothetical protein